MCNLCTINPNGTINNVALTASWANEGIARIAITNNYQPVDSNEYANKLSLVAYEGVKPTGATYKGFKSKGNGVYELDEPTISGQPAVLPPGLYAVNLEGEAIALLALISAATLLALKRRTHANSEE